MGGGVDISLIGKINPEFKGIWFSGTAEDSTGFTIQLEGKTVEIPVVDGKFEYKNNVKLTTYNQMFLNENALDGLAQNTYKITSLDLSKTKAIDLSTWMMFYGCSHLKKLDLSGFKLTKEVNQFSYMFEGCNALEEIILSDTFTANKLLDVVKECIPTVSNEPYIDGATIIIHRS